VEGAYAVVHTASPVGANPENHADMIDPAVNGVRSILEAAREHGCKRVVITSSCSAVACCKPEERPADGVYTEAQWSCCQTYHFQAYTKSKTMAEQAAWAFKDGPEIVTICPSFILGEVIGAGELTSATVVKRMLTGGIPGWP